jgi:hypothetical protein
MARPQDYAHRTNVDLIQTFSVQALDNATRIPTLAIKLPAQMMAAVTFADWYLQLSIPQLV